MRTKLLALMMICFGAVIFANDTTVFRDEDMGLAIAIPTEIKMTWNISNYENDIEVTIFNSDGKDDADIAVVAIGRIPLALSQNMELDACCSAILEEIQQTFSSSECYMEEGYTINIDPCPSLAPQAYPAQRFRVFFYSEEDEYVCKLDMHLFVHNDHMCFIATGLFPTDDGDDLELLTRKILNTMSFTQQ